MHPAPTASQEDWDQWLNDNGAQAAYRLYMKCNEVIREHINRWLDAQRDRDARTEPHAPCAE